MTRFGYPVSLSHDFQIEVGSDGVTINGRSKSESGHAMFADVAGIFIWDSGGNLNERALALSLQDGRTVAFRVLDHASMVAIQNSDAGVGSTQVNTDDFTHLTNLQIL